MKKYVFQLPATEKRRTSTYLYLEQHYVESYPTLTLFDELYAFLYYSDRVSLYAQDAIDIVRMHSHD